MGSYGIGPARIVAAAVEQFADEHGISWPRALAPFAVHLVALGKPGTPEREAADRLYETLLEGGVEVLYDDRDAGPGEKFADAELLGCPLRLTVGRTLAGVGRGRGAAAPRARERGRWRSTASRGADPGGGRAVAEPPLERRRTAAPRRAPAPRRPRGCSGWTAPGRRRRRRAPASRCGRGRSPTRSASCAWR